MRRHVPTKMWIVVLDTNHFIGIVECMPMKKKIKTTNECCWVTTNAAECWSQQIHLHTAPVYPAIWPYGELGVYYKRKQHIHASIFGMIKHESVSWWIAIYRVTVCCALYFEMLDICAETRAILGRNCNNRVVATQHEEEPKQQITSSIR